MAIGSANQSNAGKWDAQRGLIDGECMSNGNIAKHNVRPVQSIYVAGKVDVKTDARSIKVPQPELARIVMGRIVTDLDQARSKTLGAFFKERYFSLSGSNCRTIPTIPSSFVKGFIVWDASKKQAKSTDELIRLIPPVERGETLCMMYEAGQSKFFV
jgi:hypothetical protein